MQRDCSQHQQQHHRDRNLRSHQQRIYQRWADTSASTTHKPAAAFPLKLCQLLCILLVHLCFLFHPASSMKLVIQRVKSASVTVDGSVISSIGPGVMALVGLHQDDTQEDLQYCCKRLLAAKLFANDNDVAWRHGVKQRNLELLCVSQFTLYGKLTKKHQPDYKVSMKSIPAQEMYANFIDMLKAAYEPDKIKDGEFGAKMDVALVNDGPVTIVVETEPKTPDTNGTDTAAP
mmetsp:Transcript_2494/g.6950  ORF Transcript_2494/g.6950 Transcript_2494/m.6950 type:complete len:232 (-) Transcript_2494:424-1119(-)|eukprot:CAMPEP_0198135782 /NCGR_PEP_ID=MMETSP1442-20131203/60771_1 /TAXON_ID= /ORGANISM="Craspedostauros australis, Strain CCMP3328" /LENGTH=231 /DNA_ID=CAMNT_0043796969 /DNA_START=119 /DNA_END=814 /DNA_ORIENTATION=-